MKTKKFDAQPFRFNTHNGYFNGFFLKRVLTTKECRYVLNNILGIAIDTRDCFEDKESYQEYNDQLTKDVNDWLKGKIDDVVIMEYSYDCSDEPLGMFNSLNIVMYLQKHGII